MGGEQGRATGEAEGADCGAPQFVCEAGGNRRGKPPAKLRPATGMLTHKEVSLHANNDGPDSGALSRGRFPNR